MHLDSLAKNFRWTIELKKTDIPVLGSFWCEIGSEWNDRFFKQNSLNVIIGCFNQNEKFIVVRVNQVINEVHTKKNPKLYSKIEPLNKHIFT